MFKIQLYLLAILFTSISNLCSTHSIEIEGKIFKRNGERFFIRGIAYQPEDNIDPICDEKLSQLNKDIKNFKTLNINAIRVYQVELEKKHDEAMEALKKAGIYVLVGCVNAHTGISPKSTEYDPKKGPYNPNSTRKDDDYPLPRIKKVVDAFHTYSNVLGFSVANEIERVSGAQGNKELPELIDKLIKDVKTYITSKGRKIPVGLALSDDEKNHKTITLTKFYLKGHADFIGYNCYRWAGGEGEEAQKARREAYKKLYDSFEDLNKPLIMTEFGTTEGHGVPRSWNQIPYLFGIKKIHDQYDLSKIFSGGFAFRYVDKAEKNHPGLIHIELDSPKIINKEDFNNLAKQYKKVKDLRK